MKTDSPKQLDAASGPAGEAGVGTMRAMTTYSPLPTDRPVRWGILATGGIAATFTADLQLIPDDAQVVAVGSRRLDAAERFAVEHQIPRAHSSYEQLAADPDVDAVYVATPHSHHLDAAALCLEAGKHVLVEKPLTASLADTDRLLELARSKGLFLMEAMWTRCNPLIRRASELASSELLGPVRHLVSGFGFHFDGPTEHRLLNPELAGGAILDLGPYPAHMAHLFLGSPTRLDAVGVLADTGVDAQASALWSVEDADRPAASASLMVSLLGGPAQYLSVICESGRIDFPDGFIAPRRMTVTRAGGEEEFTAHVPGRGYTFQTQEVARCLRAGLTETPLVHWGATREVAGILAEWREKIGS